MKYKIILREVTEGGYIVLVPSLPGCVSYGTSVEEALAHVKEATMGYIETLYEIGKEIPKETSTITTEYEVEIND